MFTLLNNLALAWAGLNLRPSVLDIGYAALLVVVIVWSVRVEGLSLATLGLSLNQAPRDVLLGLALGSGMAVPAIIFYAFPVIVAGPVSYAGYRFAGPEGILAVLFVRLLVGHALLEETLFRGLIQVRAIDWWGQRKGIVASTLAFVLWHPVLTYHAIAQTNLVSGPFPVWLLCASASIPLTAAGLILALLRERTGTLIAPIAAHWTVNATIMAFLALMVDRAGA